MTEHLLSVGIDIGTSFPDTHGVRVRVPKFFQILGGSKFRLRKISALLRFYGLTPAPPRGAPAVEVPK